MGFLNILSNMFLLKRGPWGLEEVPQRCKVDFPASIYLHTVNIRNTRTKCKICSKLTLKTPERRHWRRSGVFIVNFEHISHLVLVFLLLTLNRQMPAGLMSDIFLLWVTSVKFKSSILLVFLQNSYFEIF